MNSNTTNRGGAPLGNQNAVGNSGGKSGRSGPPGNANAAGNAGGKANRSGPPGNANALGNAGGPPKANRNALSHGVHSFLATGRFPPGTEHIADDVASMRQQLEQATADAYGEVSITRAALIQSIGRHETVARLYDHYLSTRDNDLTTDQRLKILSELSRATDKRDAAIEKLGLDRDQRASGPDWSRLTIPADQAK